MTTPTIPVDFTGVPREIVTFARQEDGTAVAMRAHPDVVIAGRDSITSQHDSTIRQFGYFIGLTKRDLPQELLERLDYLASLPFNWDTTYV